MQSFLFNCLPVFLCKHAISSFLVNLFLRQDFFILIFGKISRSSSGRIFAQSHATSLTHLTHLHMISPQQLDNAIKKCEKDGSSFNTLNSFIRLKRDKTSLQKHFAECFQRCDLSDWEKPVSRAFLTTNEMSLIVTNCSYQQKVDLVQQSRCAIKTTLAMNLVLKKGNCSHIFTDWITLSCNVLILNLLLLTK